MSEHKIHTVRQDVEAIHVYEDREAIRMRMAEEQRKNNLNELMRDREVVFTISKIAQLRKVQIMMLDAGADVHGEAWKLLRQAYKDAVHKLAIVLKKGAIA